MGKTATTTIPETFESVANLFSVLADPTRLNILHLLKQEPAYVSEIVERLGLKQSNVSKHLSLMYDTDLVGRERHGNQIRYSISDPLVFDLCNLVCRKLHREARSQERIFRRIVG